MKTLEELKGFFYQTIVPNIAPLEEERKRVAKQLVIAELVVAALAMLIGSFALTSGSRDTGGLLQFVIFGSIMAGVGLYWFFTRSYTNAFKEQIIRRIIAFIDPALNYYPSRYVLQPVYQESRLFKQRVDFYRGDDLVSGRQGETGIQFSELHTEYETYSNKKRRRVTIFKGLFFVADFHKHFQGETFVVPDFAEKAFGSFGGMLQSWDKSRGELVKLEDPEFEREFAVYGSDQVEARYILSTSLMKRILDFKRKHGKQTYLSFIHSKVFIAIRYSKNLFEPKIFTSLYQFQPIQEYFEDLSLALGIVDDLNLNTRIWTKA